MSRFVMLERCKAVVNSCETHMQLRLALVYFNLWMHGIAGKESEHSRNELRADFFVCFRKKEQLVKL